MSIHSAHFRTAMERTGDDHGALVLERLGMINLLTRAQVATGRKEEAKQWEVGILECTAVLRQSRHPMCMPALQQLREYYVAMGMSTDDADVAMRELESEKQA